MADHGDHDDLETRVEITNARDIDENSPAGMRFIAEMFEFSMRVAEKNGSCLHCLHVSIIASIAANMARGGVSKESLMAEFENAVDAGLSMEPFTDYENIYTTDPNRTIH